VASQGHAKHKAGDVVKSRTRSCEMSNANWALRWRISCATKRRDGRLRRGAWACTTPSFRRAVACDRRFKERLSQSALYYETLQVGDEEALAVRRWMEDRGMQFKTGPSETEDLTDHQILCNARCTSPRCASPTIRLSHDRHSVQQGLKDLLPASDLVEGTLTTRPPAGDVARRCSHALRDQPCRTSTRWTSAPVSMA